MCTLLYLLFLACLVTLLFFAGWIRWTQSGVLISRAWMRLSPRPAHCAWNDRYALLKKVRLPKETVLEEV